MRWYIISDAHITGGVRRLQNINTEYLTGFINRLNQKHRNSDLATLIFNGDFFDFYSVTLLKKKDNKRIVLKKATEIKKGNQDLFKKLGQWLENNNKLIFIIGNHDYLLLNSRYREIVKKVCFRKRYWGLIKVKKQVLLNKSIFIEHGHRWDPLYYTNKPFWLMEKIRKSFRENLVDVLSKYPKICYNRQIKYFLFYFLPLIDFPCYLKLGFKSILGHVAYSLLRIGNCFRISHSITSKRNFFKSNILFPLQTNKRMKIKTRGLKNPGYCNLRMKLVSRLLACFSKKINHQLIKTEKEVLDKIAGFLSRNPHVRYYVLGHYHVCFRAKAKKSNQVVFGMGTWAYSVPYFDVINFHDLNAVGYWIEEVKHNRDDAFSKTVDRFPYLKVSNSKVVLKFWGKNKSGF